LWQEFLHDKRGSREMQWFLKKHYNCNKIEISNHAVSRNKKFKTFTCFNNRKHEIEPVLQHRSFAAAWHVHETLGDVNTIFLWFLSQFQ